MPDHDAPTFGTKTPPGSSGPTQSESAAPQPSAAVSFADDASPLPASIGRYHILRLLGEGGMGAVYEAEQDFPHRTVALKVIRAGYASSEILRRFENEAQALARLQHAGIAQIYEAGTAETPYGRQPYFAMELVQGQTLLAYCDSHRLNARQRLELMAKICDAVQHAHQRGLIHRDLKPANILVDESGQPRILDFGVARLTDSDAQATRQTDVGQLIGTLAYMSPEQVLGDPAEIDTRSDVYALGVTLYELLAGKGPYALGRQLPEVVRTIREEEPTALSSVNRTYRGDIETIVGKALEKDKTRRYGSAAELAADIRRYLRDEPITARPPSATYQLQKFARRNRALVMGVAAVFVVLLAGVIASTWEAVQARRAEAKARQESAIAQAVNDFLQNDLLGQASAYNQAKPDPDIEVRAVLDRAAQNIQGKFAKQPEVEAAIRETIGETYRELGQYPEAHQQLERALELYRQTLAPESANTLKALNELANTAEHQGNYAEADRLLDPAVAIARRVLGPEHPETLMAMNFLASNYYYQRKFEQAEALYSQTLYISRRALGLDNPQTLKLMTGLASTYSGQGKYAEAAALFSQILETRRRVLGPEHPDTLLAMNNLATAYQGEKKDAEAEALFSQVLGIRRRVLGDEHPDTLYSMNCLADLYSWQAKDSQAEALYTQLVEIERRVLGPDNRDTLFAIAGLAVSEENQGKHRQAEALFMQALERLRRVLGPNDPFTLQTMNNLAEACQKEGKYALAETYAAQAFAGRRQVLGPRNLDTLASEAYLALAYVSEGKFLQSEPLAREALETEKKIEPDDWPRYRAASLLGDSLAGQRKYADAEPLLLEGYQGMVARKDRISAADRYHLDRAREWLAQLYQAWGKPEKAAEWREK